MQSIANSTPKPSPQDNIGHYPFVQIHHWYCMAQWPVTRMRAYLEACTGPTPEAEALRQTYLNVLRQCEQLLRVSLSPEIQAKLAHETAQLNRDCERQHTHRVGVRRRKTVPAQTAAD